MNTRSRVQFPQEQFTNSAASTRFGGMDENPAQLVELRAESGIFYVYPSKWQRLRLLWTFRHFHVLPQQVLSNRDQRLIETLARSALITPAKPVPRNAIMGVVEKVQIKSMGTAPHVVTMRPERKGLKTSRLSPAIPGLPTPGHHQRLFFDGPGAKNMEPAPTNRRVRVPQWGALAGLIAVCVLVIAARFLVGSQPVKTAQIKASPTPAAPVTQSALPALRPARPRHRLAPSPSEPSNPRPISAAELTKSVSLAPTAPERRAFVAELPQGHFAAPIMANPNQVGELHLRALIAADGSVKDVTLVSGDPKLAAAGIRAVRRWHYSPYEASATQAERETLINMKFFGQDAVSVTSLAR